MLSFIGPTNFCYHLQVDFHLMAHVHKDVKGEMIRIKWNTVYIAFIMWFSHDTIDKFQFGLCYLSMVMLVPQTSLWNSSTFTCVLLCLKSASTQINFSQVWSTGCCNRETRPSMLCDVVAIIMNDAIVFVLLVIESDLCCQVTMHVYVYGEISWYCV